MALENSLKFVDFVLLWPGSTLHGFTHTLPSYSSLQETEEISSANGANLSDGLIQENLISKYGVVHESDGSVGCGKFEFINGDTYDGFFKALKTDVIMREGNGVYTSVDGHVYDGSWASDVLDCTDALIYFPDGSCYCGSVNKMKYNGNGRYSFPDGNFVDAKFCDNILMEGEESSTLLSFVDKCDIQWFGETGKGHVTMLPVHHFIPREWKVTSKHLPQLTTEGAGITLRTAIPKFSFPTVSIRSSKEAVKNLNE